MRQKTTENNGANVCLILHTLRLKLLPSCAIILALLMKKLGSKAQMSLTHQFSFK